MSPVNPEPERSHDSVSARTAAGRTADSRLAARIFAAAHLEGEFVLRSGATSREYFDKYRFESDPELLGDIAAALGALVPAGVDALAGLELGGVPLAVALSRECGLPARFVRKEPKPYGTRGLAEGGEIGGLRLAVVEDVVTSGGQVVASCRALREHGAHIVAVLCVIDREAGGGAALAAEGLSLLPLFTASQLRAATPR